MVKAESDMKPQEGRNARRRVRRRAIRATSHIATRGWMERRINLSLYSVAAAAVLMSLGACLPAGDRAPDRVEAPRPTGWVAPPRIESVSHSRSGLVVQGVAEPGGRVVMRGQ